MIKKYTPDTGTDTDSWHMDAACRSIGEPEIFFPQPTEQKKYGAAGAMPYCGACPVMYECLKAALDGGEYGTWGGMTHTDRLRLKSRVTREQYATVEALRELLEVTMPRCVGCDRHRKPKAEDRCAECYRVYVKAQEAAAALAPVKQVCSMTDCGLDVHAKGKCTKHYHADLRASKSTLRKAA